MFNFLGPWLKDKKLMCKNCSKVANKITLDWHSNQHFQWGDGAYREVGSPVDYKQLICTNCGSNEFKETPDGH